MKKYLPGAGLAALLVAISLWLGRTANKFAAACVFAAGVMIVVIMITHEKRKP